jgi:hypothetical protein
MRWIKSSESLPAEGVEVLIRCNDEVNIAAYDKKRKLFVLRSGDECDPAKEQVAWAEILRPNDT